MQSHKNKSSYLEEGQAQVYKEPLKISKRETLEVFPNVNLEIALGSITLNYGSYIHTLCTHMY